MKRNYKKGLLISIVVILAVGLSVAFYMYNKGPLDVKNSKAVSVNATELYATYTKDTVEAKNKYTSRVLLVEGEVSSVSVNSKMQKVVLLKTGVEGAYVNCTLEGPGDNIVASNKISLKGICSGIGQGDADLGIAGDVYLTRCFVTNNK